MESASLDFINLFHPTVIEMIFQHMTGKEILSATLVSSDWNDFLSKQSLTSWNNVWFRPSTTSNSDDSSRRYANVILHKTRLNVTENFLKKAKFLKDAVICSTIFKDNMLFAQTMQAAAKSLVELSIKDITCENMDETSSSASFDFPHLKTLTVIMKHPHKGSHNWVTKVLGSAPQLTHIYLEHASDSNTKNLILTSPALKSFKFRRGCEDETFFKDLAMKMPSQLEEFDFKNISGSMNLREFFIGIDLFLKSQAKTLQAIRTDSYMELSDVDYTFNLPKLHTLEIQEFNCDGHDLEVFLEGVRARGANATSLRTLHATNLCQNLLEVLAVYAQGVETIECGELSAHSVSNPAWFPKLRKFSCISASRIDRTALSAKFIIEMSKLEFLIHKNLVDHDNGIYESSLPINEIDII